jgi:hypothetical protein
MRRGFRVQYQRRHPRIAAAAGCRRHTEPRSYRHADTRCERNTDAQPEPIAESHADRDAHINDDAA